MRNIITIGNVTIMDNIVIMTICNFSALQNYGKNSMQTNEFSGFLNVMPFTLTFAAIPITIFWWRKTNGQYQAQN